MNAFENRVDVPTRTPDTPKNNIINQARKGIAAVATTIAMAGGVQAANNLPTLDPSQFQEGVEATACINRIGSFAVKKVGGKLYALEADYKARITETPIAQYIEERMKEVADIEAIAIANIEKGLQNETGRMLHVAVAKTLNEPGNSTPQGTCPTPMASN